MSYQSFVCTQFEYENSSIWPIDKTLSGATPLDQSGHGNNSNLGAIHIRQSSRTGALPSDCLVSYIRHSLWGFLPLWRDAIDVFYSPSRRSFLCSVYSLAHTHTHTHIHTHTHTHIYIYMFIYTCLYITLYKTFIRKPLEKNKRTTLK